MSENKQDQSGNQTGMSGKTTHTMELTTNQLMIVSMACKMLSHVATGESMAIVTALPLKPEVDTFALRDSIQAVVMPHLGKIGANSMHGTLGYDALAISKVIGHSMFLNNGRMSDASQKDAIKPKTFGNEPLPVVVW